MNLYSRLSTKPITTNYLYNISMSRKVLYVETPKVACTQIKRMLQRLEAGSSGGVPQNVHDRNESPLFSPKHSEDTFFSALYGEYFRFSFVRNPITRVLSCYLDKFVSNKWEKARRLPGFGFEPDYDLSFLEFLNFISNQNPIDMDVHWMPQTTILSLGSVKYDFIGRFENFSADFQRICRYLGVEEFHDNEGREHRTNASDVTCKFYGDRELEIVRRLYREDFELLMYSKNLLLC